MRDLWTHLGLFLLVAFVIVVLGAFYGETDDREAFKSLPRRFLTFVIGCIVLTAIVLICEHTFAAV